MKNKPSRQMQRARQASALSTPQRQRGAAAIFFAFAIGAMIISLLLGINIGILYFAQRDLQREASVAALAGAQVASGCRADGGLGGTPGTLAAVTTRVTEALANNSSSSNTANLLTGIAGQPAVQLGRTDYISNTSFVFVPLTQGDSKIDTVRVNLSRTTPTPLGSMFSTAPQTLYASATAWQPALGSFYLSTGLLCEATPAGSLTGPLLSGLLHTSVDLCALNSNGLAQAQVTLAGLEAAAGVTNLNDLLTLQTNLTGALNILGQAVSGTGGGLISGLAGQVYNTSGGPTQAYFGDLFGNIGGSLNPLVTDVASSVPFVDALDLLAALGEDAAVNTKPVQPINLQPGNSFLNLLNLPGLASLQTFVTIIQPPQFALGPALPTTQAKSAQVQLGVRATVGVPGILSTNLGVDLLVADAVGTLTSLQCPRDGTPNPSALVGVGTQVAKLTVGPFDPSAQSTGEPLGHGNILTVLGGAVATVGLTQGTIGPVQVGTTLSQTTGPYDTYTSTQGVTASNGAVLAHQTVFTAVGPDNTATVGSSAILASTINSLLTSLTANNNLKVCLLGVICVGPLVDPILAALNGLLTPVAAALDQVLQLLEQLVGLQLGLATVNMAGATIGEPVVISTCVPIPVPKGTTPSPGICS